MRRLPNKLLIATHNPGKVQELKELFNYEEIHLYSALDFNIPEPEENGLTFKSNALLKATAYGQAAKLPALADDSGLCVEALKGDPGIYSARWAGVEKNFLKAIERIEQELLQLPEALLSYQAFFVCALALWFPNGKTLCVEGKVHGTLTFPPRGTYGFGYDPIFIPNGYQQTFGEMDPALKHRISHRAKAWEELQALL